MQSALVCLAIVLGLLSLFAPPTLVEQIELRVLDWHARIRGHLPPPANISIVAIDETSLELVGRWPWPRTRTAEIVQRLTEGGARVIALDLLLREPDENSRLVLARSLAERYRELGSPGAPGSATSFGKLLEEALSDADTDETLAQALAATRRVVVPYFFVFPPHESPRWTRSLSVSSTGAASSASPPPRRSRRSIHAARPSVQLPLVSVRHRVGRERSRQRRSRRGRRAAPDRAGHPVRRRALSQPDSRDRAPGAGPLADPGPPHGRSGGPDRATVVPTDDSGVLHLSYYGPAGTFRTIPAVDILTGSSPPSVKDHVVLVGFTAHGLMDVRPTPFDSVMPGVESHATGSPT